MSKETQNALRAECMEISNLLVSKNRAYGDSAVEPISVAACEDYDALEKIAVRIDDKLARMRNLGGLARCLADTEAEDTGKDLIGYLILARVAHKAAVKAWGESEDNDEDDEE